MKCKMCPRECGIDREKFKGYCGEGQKIRIAKIIPNFMWEEPPVSREKGTCAIFFSGCNLRCSFCQNYKISRNGFGEEYTPKAFARLLKEIDSWSCESIDLITPTHFSDQIIEAFKIYRPKKPIVWNSSGYEKVEKVREIAPYVDIFLPDFKYFDGDLSKTFSNAGDYFSVASKAIVEMCKLKPNVFKDGEIIEGVIIRHLVLPEHTRDSLKILDFIKLNIENPVLSIMSQYIPSGEIQDGRRLFKLEYKTVLNHLRKLGLLRGYFQEMESANEKYIPDFGDDDSF